ncbi:MAG: GntR family transcriptional regulator [Candidatus Rokuibacteriota bacterium]
MRKRAGRLADGTQPPTAAGPPSPETDGTGPIAEQIERGERPMAVYKYLRELIVRGHLAPGSPLVEIDIAERLGVSRTPVRGALERLHQQGFIIDSASPRLFKFAVAPLTREDAQALYHIVAELDGLAAHYAAAIPAEARQRLVRSLHTANAELHAASTASPPDHDRLYELDEAFHRRYLDAAANPRLMTLHDAVKPQVERYARVYVMLLADEMHVSIAEHTATIHALASGSAEAAQQAARTNWRNAGERLSRAIARMGERGRW